MKRQCAGLTICEDLTDHASQKVARDVDLAPARQCLSRRASQVSSRRASPGLGGGALDVFGPRTLRSLANVKLDTVAFAQVVDALTVDGALVEEYSPSRCLP